MKRERHPIPGGHVQRRYPEWPGRIWYTGQWHTDEQLGRRKEYLKSMDLPDRLKKYGITKEDFSYLLGKQLACCPICEKRLVLGDVESKAEEVAFDHDHSKNKGEPGYVRGLLHSKCNRYIGLLGDDAAKMERAAKYLKEGVICR